MNTVMFDARPVTPTKLVSIGRNYLAHIDELGNARPTEPVIFIKPNSAIADSLYFDPVGAIHYEGEIAFIIEQNQIAGVGFGFCRLQYYCIGCGIE